MGQTVHTEKLDLREYVAEITRELGERIEHQRQVMLKLIGEREQKGQPIDYCPLVDCGPRKRLREALRETVAVLEDTRRAFKSKRLEELRLKLESLLAEENSVCL